MDVKVNDRALPLRGGNVSAKVKIITEKRNENPQKLLCNLQPAKSILVY